MASIILLKEKSPVKNWGFPWKIIRDDRRQTGRQKTDKLAFQYSRLWVNCPRTHRSRDRCGGGISLMPPRETGHNIWEFSFRCDQMMIDSSDCLLWLDNLDCIVVSSFCRTKTIKLCYQLSKLPFFCHKT